MRKLLALGLAACLLSGCKSGPPKTVFSSVAEWEMPPAYHGNYFAPGGNKVDGAYVYEPLFMYLPSTGTYLPRLADHFTESADHLTLTVVLKPHVVWQDGSPFTSHDVEANTWLAWLTGQDLHTLDSIDCPDDLTVVFHFKVASAAMTVRTLTRWTGASRSRFGTYADAARPLFMQHVATGHEPPEYVQQIRKVREALFHFHPDRPMGTGPYQVTRVSASDVTLERFPQYRDADKVKVDTVHLQRSGDNSVLWSFLIAGDLDAATPATPYDVVQEILHKNPLTRLTLPSDNSDFGVVFNCASGVMADVALRQAVAHVINRDQVRQVAYYYGDPTDGYALGMPSRFRPQWLGEAVPSDWPRYDTDATQAEAILVKAGYRRGPQGHWRLPDGQPLEFEVTAPNGLTDLVLLAESVSTQLARFGIGTQVRTLQVEQYNSSLAAHKFTLAAMNGVSLGNITKPSVAYDRFCGPGAELHTASGIPAEVAIDGQTVDVEGLARHLDELPDGAEQQAVVRQLAGACDKLCFYLPCYEKRLEVFTVEGHRVTGWPAPDAPIWDAAPGGMELLYATLLSQGTLRPVR